MRPVILAWFQGHRATPATANMHKAGLSRLLSFAVDRGLLERNLALGLKKLSVGDRASIVWSRDQIAHLIQAAPREVGAAVALAYATAQRQGDLLTLTWNDVTDEGVLFRPSKQQKAKQRLFVPMYDELSTALAMVARAGITVLQSAAVILHRMWLDGTEFRTGLPVG